jgi:hypothetical protein
MLHPDKVWLCAFQDGFAPDPIGTPFDRALRREVYFVPDDVSQLLFHRDMIQQAPVGVRAIRGRTH